MDAAVQPDRVPEQVEQPKQLLPKYTDLSRTSRTISFLLRHGAIKEGLEMRPDGYVRVEELVELKIFPKAQ
jgi:2'-phosphotransferase